MVGTGLDFGKSVWVTTADKQLGHVDISGGSLVGQLHSDVVGTDAEMFLDEGTFRVIEMEDSVNLLTLWFHLDF